MKRKRVRPSDDIDSPPLDRDFFRKARPAREAVPGIVANPPKLGRPRFDADAPLQVVAVRITQADAETFRAQGKGWQSVVRAALEREARRLRRDTGTPMRHKSRRQKKPSRA